MKTTIALATLLFCLTVNAQRPQGKMEMAPQEVASLKAKQMTLALDLTDQQQSNVEKVFIEVAEKRKAMLESKKEKKEFSKKERFQKREKMLEEKIELKRKLKSILTEAQYEKWQEQLAKKRKSGKKSTEARRGRKH